jgi:hypothetical protein
MEREAQEKLTLPFLQIGHWAHVGNWCKDNCADIEQLIMRLTSPCIHEMLLAVYCQSAVFIYKTFQNVQWKASVAVRTVVSSASMLTVVTSDHLECCCSSVMICILYHEP